MERTQSSLISRDPAPPSSTPPPPSLPPSRASRRRCAGQALGPAARLIPPTLRFLALVAAAVPGRRSARRPGVRRAGPDRRCVGRAGSDPAPPSTPHPPRRSARHAGPDRRCVGRAQAGRDPSPPSSPHPPPTHTLRLAPVVPRASRSSWAGAQLQAPVAQRAAQRHRRLRLSFGILLQGPAPDGRVMPLFRSLCLNSDRPT